uniref:Uncharacterized protein n=1 Tax=Chromera velia CCMP2878 TaxID=1169474 RepID=A0A0K6S872_9ALVE|eukprot:Cvel_5149.t1-p1 / transcript=Cvel_5149.t1 / gene=Cvel_5149 / organism=Chromera_velia_CCMP2878 / gene_product=hypothetical protein / transcript_product=hypothetical protein / location=Cvel_scaffold236:7887-8504(+) / protein_length=206 / sequence_SO=supercontig / SO=protein_coding / is_pseudo=false
MSDGQGKRLLPEDPASFPLSLDELSIPNVNPIESAGKVLWQFLSQAEFKNVSRELESDVPPSRVWVICNDREEAEYIKRQLATHLCVKVAKTGHIDRQTNEENRESPTTPSASASGVNSVCQTQIQNSSTEGGEEESNVERDGGKGEEGKAQPRGEGGEEESNVERDGGNGGEGNAQLGGEGGEFVPQDVHEFFVPDLIEDSNLGG